MLRSSIVFFVLAACGEGVVDPDLDSETETESESESETETQADPRWVPSAFSVFSQFAVDAEAGTLKAWKVDAGSLAPFVAFRLYEDAQDPRICTVYLIMDEPGQVRLKAWAFEDATVEADGQFMEHVGFLVPEGARVEVDGCEEVNQDVFGEPGETVASKLWGVGAGNVRVDVEALFKEDITEGFWSDAHTEETLLGGSWSSDVWTPAIWASHVAVASELGEGDVLSVDGDGWPENQLSRADVLAVEATLPDAHYMLSGLLAYDADAYLY